MTKNYLYLTAYKYSQALTRLQNSIRSGQFRSLSQQKKIQIWNRLCRYARQLGITIKKPVAAACLAAGLCFSNLSSAQPFVQQTGIANPFNGLNLSGSSKPSFGDLDGDGNLDVVIGQGNGFLSYYKNTGTASIPVFILQIGAADPFNGSGVGSYSAPALVDIDGDGDLDLFIGHYGGIIFYKNTGTASIPVFTLQGGASDPFSAGTSAYYDVPSFVDIDGDGDKDAFIGEVYGSILYYENTGSASSPIFTLQSGSANPFNGVSVTNDASPSFVDIDGDGDTDCFIGAADGTIYYYKNTGTSSNPVFTLQTGTLNPFNGVDVGYYSAPAFADIDNDGNIDMFIGLEDGSIVYYRNNAINLPLHLLSFSGNRQSGYNRLQWQTAAELNTQKFEIEMSSDGQRFTKIATVNASGSGSHNYSIIDKAVYNGKVFYRLNMVDIDGRSTYSQIIWIRSDASIISIYPNPVKDMLNINIGSAKILKTNAELYDFNGRLLQNILIDNYQQQINIQSLSKGEYLLKFADGTTQRFVKE